MWKPLVDTEFHTQGMTTPLRMDFGINSCVSKYLEILVTMHSPFVAFGLADSEKLSICNS